ncbi:YtzH-like family protein [Shouchella clausii]|jgi:hypothetical protein|uniref:Uncharacterized protein n=2 Tax=Shouchella clausii TaxID=79880 RepID=Q5WE97_SHOC1|nr:MULTISPECIES: YtzH-like family protein [Shouchella]PAD41432.1 hypothetical protein CHH54_17275 [Bacillus sp. 7520-S]SPT80596.1 Uncharacterised protein [Niallia circulans]ALA54298.1 hypothetical protein DB29_03470 [Shouchella clausii]AST96955.1 hypothetical protein BC8716_13750 [Shouchella clausii]KKI86445.1 hypothetical protein WZ76_10635 [Shouchella clausii]
MPISIQHKLGLLQDLLQNHVSEKFLTTNESEQLKQILTALAQDPALDPALASTIDEISSASHTETMDSEAVQQWLNTMSSLT